MITLLRRDGLINAAKLEFGAITPIAFAESNGIHLDRTLWEQQTKASLELHAQLTEELQQMFAAGALQTNLFGRCDINRSDGKDELLESESTASPYRPKLPAVLPSARRPLPRDC